MKKPEFIRELQEFGPDFINQPEELLPNWSATISGDRRRYATDLMIPKSKKYISNNDREYLSGKPVDPDLTEAIGRYGLAEQASIRSSELLPLSDVLHIELGVMLGEPVDFLTRGDNKRILKASRMLLAYGFNFYHPKGTETRPPEQRLKVINPVLTENNPLMI